MRRACSLLALLSLAGHASGVAFVVRPGGKEECINEVLLPEALRPGMTLPETFLGRSAFLLRPLEGGKFMGAQPSLQATIRGPSGLVLWQQQITPSFKDDAVFGGDGLGDYSLCFAASVPPGAGTPRAPSVRSPLLTRSLAEPWPENTGVAVDFFYLFPYGARGVAAPQALSCAHPLTPPCAQRAPSTRPSWSSRSGRPPPARWCWRTWRQRRG